MPTQIYEDRLLVRQFYQGAPELYLLPLTALSARKEPSPTLLRLAYEVAFMQEQQRIAKAAEQQKEEIAAEPEATPAPEPAEPVAPESPPETTPSSPVRYYIFDEEPEPYEVRNTTEAPRQRPVRSNRPRITTTIFGRIKAPKLEEVEVSRGKSATNTWRNDYFGG